MIERDDNSICGVDKGFFILGLIASISAHVILVALACLRMHNVISEFKNNEPIVVYSVSVEGGKKLGGIQQVSKTGKKEPIVPYKKVEEQEAPAPKKEDTNEELVKIKEAEEKAKKEKELKEKKEKEEAEISLKKKKEEEAKKAKEAEEKAKKEKAEKEKKAKEEAAKKAAEEKAKKEAAEKKAKEEAAKKAAQNAKNAKPNGVKGGTGKADSTAALDTKLQKALQRYIGESSNAGGVGFGAAKITGENGMGGGVVRPPEFFKYKEILEKHIKANWNWFDTSQPYKAQIQMSIDERGNITKYAIVTSSGNSRYDDSVLRAVQKATPVPPPPANVYEFFKDVRLTLEPQS